MGSIYHVEWKKGLHGLIEIGICYYSQSENIIQKINTYIIISNALARFKLTTETSQFYKNPGIISFVTALKLEHTFGRYKTTDKKTH